MCYERWSETKQADTVREKARKEAGRMIEKVKTAPPPAPEKEVEKQKEPALA